MGWFKFDGKDSREFGLQVEHIPAIPTPERILNEFSVPGRNGVLHYDTGSFSNVTVEYECWFRAYDRQRIVPELGRRINGWLLGNGFGYRLLQDSYSPDFVRMAIPATGAGEIVNRFMLHGRCTVAFNCKPQQFLLSGLLPMTISSGTFDAAQPDASRTGETHTVEWQAPAVAITRTATQARQSNSVDLDKARLVVSVGRGIGSKENIALAEQLCKAIGAELACSRPVAENEKWMEHERYVGISNLMLKPELYLAVGISGQIQHMVGANASQTIFAINKDKNAPIFQYADYGIVGDAVKILPALTAALAR